MRIVLTAEGDKSLAIIPDSPEEEQHLAHIASLPPSEQFAALAECLRSQIQPPGQMNFMFPEVDVLKLEAEPAAVVV